MKRARVHKYQSEHNQQRCIRATQSSALRFTRLEEMPIADPFHEKCLFERGDSERNLYPQNFPGPILCSDEARGQRIIDVYRLCYEARSEQCAREKVIRDFVAHWPRLVFDAVWLKDLIRRFTVTGSTDDSKKGILIAIANGFRGAASDKKREPAVQKAYRVHAAQRLQNQLNDELKRWESGHERRIADGKDPQWRTDCEAKVKEIARNYSKVGKREKACLMKMLQEGRCYDASMLVIASVFGIPVRTLQSNFNSFLSN